MQNRTLRALVPYGLVAAAAVSWTAAPVAAGPGYDPLAISEGLSPAPLDLTVTDAARQREIPIRVYLPVADLPAPVVLFSHGLGGTREGCAYLGRHWSTRGYVGVFLQHPGSDDSVWRGQPAGTGRAAMDEAANGRNFLLRVRDVPAVLDQLEAWNRTADHPLSGRLDLSRVGMSGHSFGAVTTQAVSGQAFARRGPVFTDPRIRAALVLSPSGPRRGDPIAAFNSVSIPWLLMTGTRDVSPIGDVDVASRLSVFPALPAGDKFELVLHEGLHSAFTERGLPGDGGVGRNPNHHRVILALSTAFWDAYLRGDEAAREWLAGEGPRGVMETPDRWQRK
ncbi:MAG: dienelactone hydrolase [Lentisphaeria bacterium]|nr:dienelactone hydrolase [Lentisphaeria bacterium]